VLIPPRVLFHCWGEKPVATIWFHFNASRQPAPGQPLPFVLSPSAAECRLLADFVKLFRTDDTPVDPAAVFHLSLGLLHVVLGRADIRWAEAPPRWMERVTAHIEQHYAQPLYRRDLARLAGVSDGVLDRAFKQHHGSGPMNFVAQMRVREAARQMTDAGASLEAIAERTGFPNRAYFSRVFKRITGQSPAEFRRAHREQL
jgi:AraC family transcriptional regulator, arabinose operon regulatory protein